MNKGTRFAVDGYDLVARAECAEGGGPPETDEFIVLNNNSTHYLLAKRERRAPSAIPVESYQYGDNNAVEQYSRALFRMYQEAVRH